MSGISDVITNRTSAMAGDSDAAKINLNQRFSTPNSSLQSGNLNIDPTVRGIQDRALGGFQNLIGQSNQLGQEFAGNQGALINARMNPLRQAIAQRRGGLQRDLGRRGVFGSFANQDVNNFDLSAGRELGDAQALATQDALSTRQNLMGFEANLNQMVQGIGSERFAQELQGLGLSSGTVQQLLQLQNQSASLSDSARQEGSKQFHTFAKTMSSAFGRGMSCWVAEELYGIDSDKTHMIREYVHQHKDDNSRDGVFFRTYGNHGQRWANELREGALDREELSTIFDKIYDKAMGEL